MSKELTPLEALNDMLEYLLTYDEFNEERHKNNAKIIETALYELEGLEKVYKVAKDYEEELTKDRDYWRDEAYKKQLKAFEIIKEKKWLVEEILNAFYPSENKYDLLKEVLL